LGEQNALLLWHHFSSSSAVCVEVLMEAGKFLDKYFAVAKAIDEGKKSKIFVYD
jgi:hypothetical protein